jgi:GTP cyclohydrolase I
MGKIEELAAHTAAILKLIGEDPEREGLQRTPERVAKAWDFLTHGYGEDPVAILQSAVFDEECRRMVLIKDIDFYSMCEHHMLPFFGQVHVAYIPDGRIVGLSKVPRMVEAFARRLQVQERLTAEIAACLQEALHPKGVMVMVEASHLCMQMRGVQKMNTRTVTYDYSGVFAEDEHLRDEFFKMLGRS